ncbi:MAG: hypothetical protein ACHQD8_01310 [Chitinophagales bacterium]
MQIKLYVAIFLLGLFAGISGSMILSNQNPQKQGYTAMIQSPADIKNNSVEIEAHFQSKVDSLVQTNAALENRAGNTKSELQRTKQDNKVLRELVDTLIAHANNATDTSVKLADCDSINATVQDFITSSNEKDSLYDNLAATLQAQVSNKDSVIGTQQQQYNCLKLSFDKSLVQQDVLSGQNLRYEKQLKSMQVKNKLLSAGLFMLTGIATYSLLQHH